MTERAFVLGLDGVPWRLIEQWTAAGHLPNFARIADEGAAGPFDSTAPATTPVAWPSIATGVRPDKHGLYDFQQLTAEYSHRMNTSADVEAPALWDVCAPSIVANVPMTYPASEIDGTMVTGMIAPEMNDRFTYPSAFREELEAEIPDYRISLPWGEYADDTEGFLPEFERLIDARRELMRLLMDRSRDWELFFFVYTGPDRLQHLYWDTDVLLDHYRELDEILGETMEYVSDIGADLFVVSDHGFGPTERVVYVNRLLADAGFLAENDLSGTRGLLARLGVSRTDISRGLSRIGLEEDRILDALPRVLVDSVAEKVPGDHVLYDVDFEETAAFMHFSGGVYVNDTERFDRGSVDPGEVPTVKRDLLELLRDARDPETGERALEVRDGAELFPTDDRSPDLIVSGRGDYLTNNSLEASAYGDSEKMAAGHRTEGIFLAWGPSIAAGVEPSDAEVFDLAPTVLQCLGRPIPERADGRVLTEVFADGTRAATAPVERRVYGDDADETAVEDDFEAVEERLQGLGYLG